VESGSSGSISLLLLILSSGQGKSFIFSSFPNVEPEEEGEESY
jgi:hypothetical protein